ncbi:MAG: hypothetical protein DHS20C14_15080 [Phycisphaeraceae bacterium]|nr:MAG: hypothetical protein DHS20C14_15080 [Phycisphaeraceae bacterium]
MYHYLDASGAQAGPVPESQLRQMAQGGTITPSTQVWTDGWADWQPASAVPGLAFAPPVSPQGAMSAAVSSPRSPWGIPAMPPSSYKPGSFSTLTWITIIGTVITTILSFAGLGLLFASLVANGGNDPDEALLFTGLILLGIAFLVNFPGAICGYILVYRWWRQIQDGFAETSPGKAVGFLFIPMFNYYWIFVAYWGLAKDLDAYTQRYGIEAPSARPGFALATLITALALGFVAACLYFVAPLLMIPVMVMWITLILRFSKISAIIAQHLQHQHHTA